MNSDRATYLQIILAFQKTDFKFELYKITGQIFATQKIPLLGEVLCIMAIPK